MCTITRCRLVLSVHCVCMCACAYARTCQALGMSGGDSGAVGNKEPFDALGAPRLLRFLLRTRPAFPPVFFVFPIFFPVRRLWENFIFSFIIPSLRYLWKKQKSQQLRPSFHTPPASSSSFPQCYLFQITLTHTHTCACARHPLPPTHLFPWPRSTPLNASTLLPIISTTQLCQRLPSPTSAAFCPGGAARPRTAASS